MFASNNLTSAAAKGLSFSNPCCQAVTLTKESMSKMAILQQPVGPKLILRLYMLNSGHFGLNLQYHLVPKNLGEASWTSDGA